ncbi:hypothetical protein LCGC14_0576570 [marine sediment metagenome]|uniref:histidine kinase n=1 Tax=marine sediment metagenome TaxID=412755 RepID=A0A0F9UQZ2_9ZZZZ|nr:MAG: Signal transduction histidine kinase [Candidatus Lokiarchaeum sp. GC14_75]HEC39570.1 HAMP domain-containing histidine kinase [bacterium]
MTTELFSLLKNSNLNDEKFIEFFKIIENQITKGISLINNVGKLSLLDEGKISLKPMSVSNVLREALPFAEKSVFNKILDIKVEELQENLSVMANEFLLDVFENILHNAIKHNQNKYILIKINISKTLHNERNYIKLEFSDNGIGVSDIRKPNVFQKNKPKVYNTKSMGIGLSLVNKIIETYDGKIWVENRIKEDHSQGSNFVILIPEYSPKISIKKTAVFLKPR